MPSVLWRCWLGSRKGIRAVKTEWWGAGMVICLERGADLHMAQLMPMPLTVFCFSKIQIGFTFVVPAHLGSPGKRAVKRVCVCVFLYEQYITKLYYITSSQLNGSGECVGRVVWPTATRETASECVCSSQHESHPATLMSWDECNTKVKNTVQPKHSQMSRLDFSWY